MSKQRILDLSVFEEETLDIKMPDGKSIHIPKPSQSMVIKLFRMQKQLSGSDNEAQLNAFNTFVLDVLNINNGGYVFDVETVEAMPLAMKSAIIKAYSDFIADIQSDPN